MKGLNYNNLKQLYNKMGYPFFEGRFNVNVFGFRSPELTVDAFNDILGVAYQDDFGRGVVLIVKGTTKPGLYYLKNKVGGINGTFILKEGYYKGCWKSGLHGGKYEALRQAKHGLFQGWRDEDNDSELDMSGEVYNDVSGLNFHTTSFVNNKEKVGAYSAGCQVVQDDKDFMTQRAIIYKSMEIYGDSVSYALFNMRDFF